MSRRIMICLLICGLLAAADHRQSLVDCAKTAYERGDLWTLLQTAEWAAANEVRMRPFLKDSRVIGSTLLAAPEPIRAVYDRGEVLVVAGRHWLWRWAPDGRPLGAGIFRRDYLVRHDIGPRGRLAGLLTSQRTDDGQHDDLTLEVLDLTTGNQRWSWRKRVAQGLRPAALVLAADGSAVGLAVRDNEAEEAGNRYDTWIIRAPGKPEHIDALYPIYGLGPGGRWLIGRGQGGLQLVRGDSREDLDRWASGPDGRLIWAADGLRLLDRDGEEHELQPHLEQIDNPRLFTQGPNVAIAGHGHFTRESIDVFGQSSQERVHGTWAIYRWDDCDDGLPVPLHSGDGILTEDEHHPHGLLLTRGRQLLRLLPGIDDQGRPTIEEHLLYQAESRIVRVDNEGRYYHCHTDDERILIVHESGALLHSFPADTRLRDAGRRHLLEQGADGQTYALHRLAPSPADRSRHDLQLPAADHFRVLADLYDRRLAVHNWQDYLFFSLPGVEPIGRAESRSAFDRVVITPWRGRFDIAGARLIAKALPIAWEPGEEPRGWQFSDAAHHPLGLVAAMRSGRLLAFDRRDRHHELTELPSTECTLLTREREPVVFVSDRHQFRLIGKLDRRGRWRPQPEQSHESPPDQHGPQGSWRVVNDRQVYPPKAGELEWPSHAFPVRHLRSHMLTKALLVVCDSVVIELAVDDARKLQGLWEDWQD